MTRRVCLRFGAIVGIGLLALLLLYSRGGSRLGPGLDLRLDGVRHNRLPLDYQPGSAARGTGRGADPRAPPQQAPPQQAPKAGARGEPVVGEKWDRPDSPAATLPDMVSLNMDDMSLPRRPPPADADTGPYSALKQLIPNLVPSIAHFTWCGRRWFEFKSYLSILSVIRSVKPDKVVLHYEFAPQHDKLYYHSWIRDLEHDFAFFQSEQMTAQQAQICHGTRDAKMAAIVNMLNQEGGMYIGENTWILDFPALNRQIDLDLSLDVTDIEGYVIMRAGAITNNNQSLDVIADELEKLKGFRLKRHECATTTQLYSGLKNPHCIVVKGGVFNRFYPSDIWTLDDPFGRVTRKVFYGTSEILQPKPTYDTLVPNIGHMIWIGGNPMDFVFYLSVLSMLYVLEVDTVYIHGDIPPKGPYWIKLMNNPKAAPRLKFITRPQPLMVYQGVIEPYYRALMSDIIRVDIMIKYGGIYADTDAIWAKPLSKEDRGYDAVASYDWVDWSFPFPDSVNFGLSYGKRNAPFWRIFRDSMRTLHNDIHGYTGVMRPYKLLEKYPHLLRIDRHLQVICYQYRCHPTWVPNYHNMSVDHVSTNSLQNWRESVNAFHWTHPNPPELANETALVSARGIFADLGRMVLSKAGLL